MKSLDTDTSRISFCNTKINSTSDHKLNITVITHKKFIVRKLNIMRKIAKKIKRSDGYKQLVSK